MFWCPATQMRRFAAGDRLAAREHVHSPHIAQLTTAVFTTAYEPVKKQIEAAQKTGPIN